MRELHNRHSRSSRWPILIGALAAALFSASAAPVPDGDDAAPPPTMMELAVARYQTAQKGYDYAIAGHKAGDAPGYDVLDWMKRRLKARLDISEPKADRIAFLKEYIEQLKVQEGFEARMVKARLTGAESLLRVQYDRIEGEMLLKQFEAK